MALCNSTLVLTVSLVMAGMMNIKSVLLCCVAHNAYADVLRSLKSNPQQSEPVIVGWLFKAWIILGGVL